MKLKIFATLLVSFVLVMGTSSGGRAVSDRLKHAASQMLVERVAGKHIPGIDVFEMVGSHEHGEAFIAANRSVSEEYGRYMAASLVVQGLLLLGIALGATTVITRLVSRSTP